MQCFMSALKKHLTFTGIFECYSLGGLELSLPLSPTVEGKAKRHHRAAPCYLAALTAELELLMKILFPGPVLALG